MQDQDYVPRRMVKVSKALGPRGRDRRGRAGEGVEEEEGGEDVEVEEVAEGSEEEGWVEEEEHEQKAPVSKKQRVRNALLHAPAYGSSLVCVCVCGV